MKHVNVDSSIAKALEEIRHFLPAQAPLKDFVHHNTLHAFQNRPFFSGLLEAQERFGYKTLLSLSEFQEKFHHGEISPEALEQVIAKEKLEGERTLWLEKMIHTRPMFQGEPQIGRLRRVWMKDLNIDLDSMVHPSLFRVLCSYLDQGIAIWQFPEKNMGFLDAIRSIEENSFSSFFTTAEAKNWLFRKKGTLEELLHRIVGDESLFQGYLIDQQFAHQGWSGIVANIEENPMGLLDTRKISLHDIVYFELLLELDVLCMKLGADFKPLSHHKNTIDIKGKPNPNPSEFALRILWQKAFEKMHYRSVLAGIDGLRNNNLDFTDKTNRKECLNQTESPSYQAVFCIDDRECSLRRHLEIQLPSCDTFGTPGFFGVATYYQPEGSLFKTKLCPAPMTPKHLVKASGVKDKRKTDAHFHRHTHTLLPGLLIAQTLGFWSAIKLFFQIFKPTMSPATATSLQHMHKQSVLTVVYEGQFEDGLQIGFTQDEMVSIVKSTLQSMGLTKRFSSLIYIVGHGSSSVNNPHFSAYDCGACCGRPGSVNARLFCAMANDFAVRKQLKAEGFDLPDSTLFVGALHDTSRDEIVFYEEDMLPTSHQALHAQFATSMEVALANNSLERSRRFVLISKKQNQSQILKSVKRRSVSLFEPRPELNHATNSLCIISSRTLTKGLFFDRRSFLNSYDFSSDTTGDILYGIIRAAAPVCGGINLEYFFSRVDNQKLGAGSKLPHNVMGLVGVANGIDGDLRPGLPSQMIEVHDPLRLLMIVEQTPAVIKQVITRDPNTYQWFENEWINLVSCCPITGKYYEFTAGEFAELSLQPQSIAQKSFDPLMFVEETDNLPIQMIH